MIGIACVNDNVVLLFVRVHLDEIVIEVYCQKDLASFPISP